LTYIFYGVTDEQLESKWQIECNAIKFALNRAYDDKATKEKSDAFMKEAKEAQSKQETIQAEITRRAK